MKLRFFPKRLLYERTSTQNLVGNLPSLCILKFLINKNCFASIQRDNLIP